MDGLHHLVAQGKVLYLVSTFPNLIELTSDHAHDPDVVRSQGVSDTPAWVVSKANTYARLTGKTPFVIYQGAWSILERDFEREIIPMARDEGMAIAPWNVLAGGRLRTDEEEQRRRQTGERGRVLHTDQWERTEDERKISQALEVVAKQIGAKNITAGKSHSIHLSRHMNKIDKSHAVVAIAYVMQKTPYVFPIIGGRKVEHLIANLEALDLTLEDEHIKYLESVLPFDFGFPYSAFVSNHSLIASPFATHGTDLRQSQGNWEANNALYNSAGNFDKWPVPQALRPAKQ